MALNFRVVMYIMLKFIIQDFIVQFFYHFFQSFIEFNLFNFLQHNCFRNYEV
jgi:hypothetical protein